MIDLKELINKVNMLAYGEIINAETAEEHNILPLYSNENDWFHKRYISLIGKSDREIQNLLNRTCAAISENYKFDGEFYMHYARQYSYKIVGAFVDSIDRHISEGNAVRAYLHLVVVPKGKKVPKFKDDDLLYSWTVATNVKGIAIRDFHYAPQEEIIILRGDKERGYEDCYITYSIGDYNCYIRHIPEEERSNEEKRVIEVYKELCRTSRYYNDEEYYNGYYEMQNK